MLQADITRFSMCVLRMVSNITIHLSRRMRFDIPLSLCCQVMASVRRMGGRLRTQSHLQLCGGDLRKPSGQFDGDLARVDIECK